MQRRLAPRLQELVASLARRHRRIALKSRERRYLADPRQVCRPGGVAKRAHARPLVFVGEQLIHGGSDLRARALRGSAPGRALAVWRARASSNAQPASWICWGHRSPPPPSASSPDSTSASCAALAAGEPVSRAAHLRRLLPLGRRPAPHCALTAVGRVQWGGPVVCATCWCGGGARARADCASGGRIISMHSAGALASPPPGLLSLRLVPRAPRVLGSPALAGPSVPLLAEGVAARAARPPAEDRAHRGPWLRRLARRDACSRSRGAHAWARAWSRRSLPPFLPPPLANAAWRSDCWTLSYSAQRDARCPGGGHLKALRSLAARRMSHDNAVNEAVASSSPCSKSFATFWRRSKSYV